jgi:hypothetical protein
MKRRRDWRSCRKRTVENDRRIVDQRAASGGRAAGPGREEVFQVVVSASPSTEHSRSGQQRIGRGISSIGPILKNAIYSLQNYLFWLN